MSEGWSVIHRLRPGLRSAWRGPGTLQFGLGTRASLALSGVTDADAGFLDLLAVGVPDSAVRGGIVPPGPARCAQLLEHLSQAELLVTSPAEARDVAGLGDARDRLEPDAVTWGLVPDVERGRVTDGWDVVGPRMRRTVRVHGLGRTGWALAATLAQAGVRITCDDRRTIRAADLGPCGPSVEEIGQPRDRTFAQRYARALPPGNIRRQAPAAEADLVVLVDHAVADTGAAAALVSQDVPHLSVVVGEARTVVGPLVLPGRTPCLRCFDLHRSERDPAWPTVAAQLASHTPGTRAAIESVSPEEPEETVLAIASAALAAAQVLAHLAGRRATSVGSTLELSLPDLLPSRRAWSEHPACGCMELGDRSAERALAATGTMLE
jgi:hypothetical protein